MMMAPWARYDESYTIPPPEIDEAGFPVNDGVDRTLSRTVYFNRVTGIAQYERPEAGMMRDVRPPLVACIKCVGFRSSSL
jgi:hypothetical protein